MPREPPSSRRSTPSSPSSASPVSSRSAPERQRAILARQGTNDQLRDQTLFQGQQSGLYTPVKVENGPWTERVKSQVYMKLLIAGGNTATNNVMQISAMPP